MILSLFRDRSMLFNSLVFEFPKWILGIPSSQIDFSYYLFPTFETTPVFCSCIVLRRLKLLVMNTNNTDFKAFLVSDIYNEDLLFFLWRWEKSLKLNSKTTIVFLLKTKDISRSLLQISEKKCGHMSTTTVLLHVHAKVNSLRKISFKCACG